MGRLLRLLGSQVGPAVAAGFTAASSQKLSRASNATLPDGTGDWWMAGWVYVTADGGTQGVWARSGDGLVYRFSGRFYLDLSGIGDVNIVHAAEGVWSFLMAYHDQSAGSIGLSIDGGAFTTRTAGSATGTGGQPLYVGAWSDGSSNFLDGRIDSLAFGKPADVSTLTTTIRDALYASGAGVRYADLSASQKTDWGLVSWWEMNEATGATRNDSHGTNHLTDHNSVAAVGGKVPGA